jgi:hypothetical protein
MSYTHSDAWKRNRNIKISQFADEGSQLSPCGRDLLEKHSWSRNSTTFIKYEGSLPYSQDDPYSEATLTPCFFKVHFNIIFPNF